MRILTPSGRAKTLDEMARAYAEDCLQAQFAVAGAADQSPANPADSEADDESEPAHEGVPDDSDHVVDM